MQIWRWGWSIGASLFFVPMLLKNWRVYYIFHNPTKHKIVSDHGAFSDMWSHVVLLYFGKVVPTFILM